MLIGRSGGIGYNTRLRMTKTSKIYNDVDWQDGYYRVFISGMWIPYSELNTFISDLKKKHRN
jgi:hypothetical protein